MTYARPLLLTGTGYAAHNAFAEDDPQGRSVGTRAVVVLHEGQVVAERYADGFDADTRQLGWSMAKSLPEGWVEYSTSLVDEMESEEEGFAAHWWVNAAADGRPLIEGLPADTFWAAGHDGQRVFVIPSADVVVVRMGFTPDIPSAELGYDRWVPDLVDALVE